MIQHVDLPVSRTSREIPYPYLLLFSRIVRLYSRTVPYRTREIRVTGKIRDSTGPRRIREKTDPQRQNIPPVDRAESLPTSWPSTPTLPHSLPAPPADSTASAAAVSPSSRHSPATPCPIPYWLHSPCYPIHDSPCPIHAGPLLSLVWHGNIFRTRFPGRLFFSSAVSPPDNRPTHAVTALHPAAQPDVLLLVLFNISIDNVSQKTFRILFNHWRIKPRTVKISINRSMECKMFQGNKAFESTADFRTRLWNGH